MIVPHLETVVAPRVLSRGDVDGLVVG